MTRIDDFVLGHAASILEERDLLEASYQEQYDALRTVLSRATDLELCAILDQLSEE